MFEKRVSFRKAGHRETAQSNHITYWWNMRFYGGVEI